MGQIYSLGVAYSLVLKLNLNTLLCFQVLSKFLLKQIFLSTEADKNIESECRNKALINQNRKIFQTKMILSVSFLNTYFDVK